MITEIDGAPEAPLGLRSWLAPALLAALCAMAIAGARSDDRDAAPTSAATPAPTSVLGSVARQAASAQQAAKLAFPRDVATLSTTAPFTTTTGLISEAQFDHAGSRYTYRLPDGRSMILMQSPAYLPAPTLVPSPSHAAPAQVRGHRAETTAAQGSSVVTWVEGGSRFVLFSTRVPIDELVRLANALR